MNENHVLQDDLRINHLNLNGLKNKINDPSILIQDIPLDYFVLSQTKLDKSFPTAQFRIPGYEIRARRTEINIGVGLIECVKKGVIWKRIQKFEMLAHESVCSELTIANIKWLCLGPYRPPTPKNVASFFEELTDSLSKGSEFYENLIILGDFNVDVKVAGRELDKLEEF